MAITIKRLNFIKALGKFQCCQKSDMAFLPDFKSKTLIYGNPKSGKTTLTKLFRVLESRDSLSEFPLAEYEFELSDGNLVNRYTDKIPHINVRVFNEQFINQNITWDDHNQTFCLKEEIDLDLFNEKLQVFLGCRDVALYYDHFDCRYWIGDATSLTKANLKRHPLDVINKTAIAFVYFTVRLRRQESIEHSVIVIDDLVNSRFLTNVFAAFLFVKDEYNRAAQLFIFTDYPLFYKLILIWFRKEAGLSHLFMNLELYHEKILQVPELSPSVTRGRD